MTLISTKLDMQSLPRKSTKLVESWQQKKLFTTGKKKRASVENRVLALCIE